MAVLAAALGYVPKISKISKILYNYLLIYYYLLFNIYYLLFIIIYLGSQPKGFLKPM